MRRNLREMDIEGLDGLQWHKHAGIRQIEHKRTPKPTKGQETPNSKIDQIGQERAKYGQKATKCKREQNIPNELERAKLAFWFVFPIFAHLDPFCIISHYYAIFSLL